MGRNLLPSSDASSRLLLEIQEGGLPASENAVFNAQLLICSRFARLLDLHVPDIINHTVNTTIAIRI